MSDAVCFFWKKEKLCIGWIKQNYKGKFYIQPEIGSEVKVAPSQILHSWSTTDLPEEPGVCSYLQEQKKLIVEHSQKHDLETLHSVVEKEHPYTFAELADLCLAEQNTLNQASFYWALQNEEKWFREKKGFFFARSPENIAIILNQEQRKQALQAKQNQETEWMQQMLAGKNLLADNEQKTEKTKFLERLNHFLHYLKASHSAEFFVSFFKENLVNSYPVEKKIIHILQTNGYPISWGAMKVQRSGMHQPPNDEIQQEVQHLQELYQNFSVINAPPTDQADLWALFRDERHLHCYTIDNHETTDYDDAISIEHFAEHSLIRLHISAIGFFIDPTSHLFKWAEKRASSLYTPKQVYPMLPPALSENLFSLQAGQTRPTLTFCWRFDQKTTQIEPAEIYCSWNNIQKNLVYEDLDTLLTQQKKDWLTINQFIEVSQKIRKKNGAMHFNRNEIKLDITNPSAIQIQIRKTTPASLLVEEMAILANSAMGEFFQQQGLLAFFRYQQPPEKRTNWDENAPIESMIPGIFSQWIIKPAKVSLTADSHSGLGVSAYSQITSPIRRFFDLVGQITLKHFFLKQPTPWSKEQLYAWADRLEKKRKEYQMLEKDLVFHWKVRYLAQNLGLNFPALLVKSIGNMGSLAYIPALDMTAEIFHNKNSAKNCLLRASKVDVSTHEVLFELVEVE